MRLIKNTTELIGIKDQNIKISLVFETDTHIEIQAKLDYPAPPCPHCQGKMSKYDFQKDSRNLSHNSLRRHWYFQKSLLNTILFTSSCFFTFRRRE